MIDREHIDAIKADLNWPSWEQRFGANLALKPVTGQPAAAPAAEAKIPVMFNVDPEQYRRAGAHGGAETKKRRRTDLAKPVKCFACGEKWNRKTGKQDYCPKESCQVAKRAAILKAKRDRAKRARVK